MITYASDVTQNCSLSDNYGGLFNEIDETNAEILWGYYRLKANTRIGNYEELIRTYPNISQDDCINSSRILTDVPMKAGQSISQHRTWLTSIS